MDILDLVLGVVGFTAIVLVLVLIILAARSQLVSTGAVSIEINGDSANPITCLLYTSPSPRDPE